MISAGIRKQLTFTCSALNSTENLNFTLARNNVEKNN